MAQQTKIQFICRANMRRSQIAEALFNKMSKNNSATSAGTHVGYFEGEKIPSRIVEMMKKEGCDLSKNKMKQVTKEMVHAADKIVVMTDKENVPDFVENSGKTIYWKIRDPEHGYGNVLEETKDQIKKKVGELVRQLSPRTHE